MYRYSDGEIGRVLKHRVCARCYGDLVQKPAENRTWTAECPTCGQAWGSSTVSRYTAERRGQQALAERIEIRTTLADLFPSEHKGRPAKELLRELGAERCSR